MCRRSFLDEPAGEPLRVITLEPYGHVLPGMQAYAAAKFTAIVGGM